ncbi:type II toxin-antitoxin system death-on-curing family toxin [Candidatus Kaiserbacteria bacterium]|nr:type II toxin-antitoxin system death-on-curing family toxin [Candidatus Kaiserbacteria bacterium]
MEYLSAADMVGVHDRIIEETGGMLGVREENLLQSIAARPKTTFGNTEQFSGVFTKAAVYLESIATYHVFLDGNKRTALSVAAVFLLLNGYEMMLPVEESETFMLAAAQRQKTLEETAAWLKKHSRKKN